MHFISKNIRYLRVSKGLSQEQLADSLGITRSRIGSYEEGRSEPKIDALIMFSTFFKLPIDALVKVNLTKADGKPYIDIGNNRVLFPIAVTNDNENLIEVVPVKASAGYLQGYADPEYIEQLQHVNLPFLPNEKCRAFPIIGDSMPPLKDGNLVVGKFVEDFSQVKNNKTYIILTQNDGLVYKRVKNNMATEQCFELISDNPLYAPYQVKAHDIIEMWEYVCVIATNLEENNANPVNDTSIIQILHKIQHDVEGLKGRI